MKVQKIIVIAAIAMMTIGCAKEEQCIDETKINPTAPCTMDYRPVCGCDGNTYGNSCAATNAGLLSWTDGECN